MCLGLILITDRTFVDIRKHGLVSRRSETRLEPSRKGIWLWFDELEKALDALYKLAPNLHDLNPGKIERIKQKVAEEKETSRKRQAPPPVDDDSYYEESKESYVIDPSPNKKRKINPREQGS